MEIKKLLMSLVRMAHCHKSFEDARIDDGYFDKMYLQERDKKPARSRAKPKRARDNKGHFIADDPETEVNEAYEVKSDD